MDGGQGWLGPQQRKQRVLPYSPLKSHSGGRGGGAWQTQRTEMRPRRWEEGIPHFQPLSVGGICYEATDDRRSRQLREGKGPCWTCPPTLPHSIPTSLHPLSAPEADAVGCVHQAPLPSGSHLGLASGGTRRKPGWEAGERSAPLSPQLTLLECDRTPTCSSTQGRSSQRVVAFLQPLASLGPRVHSPLPLRAQRTNGPAVAGPGALRQPWLLSLCDPALAFIRNAVKGLSLAHLECPT